MKRRGFSIYEAIALLVLAVLIIAILLPAFRTRRHYGGRNMQSNTQVRGIQSALVLYAAGNNMHYVGLNTQGEIASIDSEGDGYDASERMEELLDEAYFTGEYVISPAEVKTSWTTGDLSVDQYSYALLAIDQEPERAEWKDTIRTEALVVSDRAATGSGPDDITSVWTTDAGDWRGSFAWNDNHVRFEQTHQGFTTKYGEHLNENNDDIFNDEGAETGDALMVFEGVRGVYPK